MKELILLAKEKGFKTKTLSTIWVERTYIGEKTPFLSINNECEISYLAELQNWLIHNYRIVVLVEIEKYEGEYIARVIRYNKFMSSPLFSNIVGTYKQALKEGLFKALNDI